MKYKAHGKKPNEEGDKLWFSLDLVCIEMERDLKYFLKYKRNNPESNLNKPLFTSLEKYLKEKNKDFDCEDLYQFSCGLKKNKIFENFHDAEHLISLFNQLNIPPPDPVFDCFHEAFLRSNFIKKVVANKGILWSEEEKKDFLVNLQININAASIDEAGAKKELTEIFYQKNEELKKITTSLKERFGISTSGHFMGEDFIANEEDVNYFFIDGLKNAGGIQGFHTLRSSYQDVLLIKCQMQALKKLLKEKDLKLTNDVNLNGLPANSEIIQNQEDFSVLQWATIFYYADETKLTDANPVLNNRLHIFMHTHKLTTTFKYIRTKYYESKKKINITNNYPIKKLETILPFLQKHYPQTVIKAENDISILEEEKLDY